MLSPLTILDLSILFFAKHYISELPKYERMWIGIIEGKIKKDNETRDKGEGNEIVENRISVHRYLWTISQRL